MAVQIIAHEGLNVLSATLVIIGYGGILLQLLRRRSALGISLQSQLAICLSGILSIIVDLIRSSDLKLDTFRAAHFGCRLITVFLGILVYNYVLISFESSYEYHRDSFGVSWKNFLWLNKRVRSNEKEGLSWLRLRTHWWKLYGVSVLLGLCLSSIRRKLAERPYWFSFCESTVEMLCVLSVLPQLWILRNRPRSRNRGMVFFMMTLFLSKCLSGAYWASDIYVRRKYAPGRGIHMLGEFLSLVVLFTFLVFCGGKADACLPL